MTVDDEESGGAYASPPCFLHEVDPAYSGLPQAEDAVLRRDVMRWRKAERRRLIAARMGLDARLRADRDARIRAILADELGDLSGRVISFYWPFRAEPDIRPLMTQVVEAGAAAALPVVVAKGQPLVFRRWTPGAAMARGVWDIPIPADPAEVRPDTVIAPVVGFDPGGYRLGYGGGFFDRTLAALTPRPRAIGVGYGEAGIPTIFPLAHDIPMTAIVTEGGPILPSDADRSAP